jgi:hypothetical protein
MLSAMGTEPRLRISDSLKYFIFLKSTARFSFVLMSPMSSTKAISFGAGKGLASSLSNSVRESSKARWTASGRQAETDSCYPAELFSHSTRRQRPAIAMPTLVGNPLTKRPPLCSQRPKSSLTPDDLGNGRIPATKSCIAFTTNDETKRCRAPDCRLFRLMTMSSSSAVYQGWLRRPERCQSAISPKVY